MARLSDNRITTMTSWFAGSPGMSAKLTKADVAGDDEQATNAERLKSRPEGSGGLECDREGECRERRNQAREGEPRSGL